MKDVPEWKLVPVERTYDMRVKAILAFNKAEKDGQDRDDALSAAFLATLNAAPTPPASAQDDAKVYHFEQRSRFGPWIEVEKPTERSVEFVQRAAAPAAGDARDAERWRFVRRKLCLTGNGDGTCAMHAINLPASIHGWPEPGSAVAEFCDNAIDAAIAAQQGKGGAAWPPKTNCLNRSAISTRRSLSATPPWRCRWRQARLCRCWSRTWKRGASKRTRTSMWMAATTGISRFTRRRTPPSRQNRARGE